MMLRRYAAEVENLKAAIAAGETAVADGELARERDSARAQVGELRSQKDHVRCTFLTLFIFMLHFTLYSSLAYLHIYRLKQSWLGRSLS